jgi:serine/threonine protein kinase
MSTQKTSVNFLELLRKSGLLSDAQVEEFFNGEAPDDAAQCAATLVKAELLTPYQAKQLLAGKHRGFFLGPYKVLRPIGQGGMGAVFLAEHTSLDRRVAIKVLSHEKAKDKLSIERFFREARAAAALDHPNIVKLFDISQGNGVHFLVFEFVDGSDLQSLMATTGPLHYAQAALYVAQAAAGLHHAHGKGFIHRDIKPANLILSKEGGAVKILDMGLARSFANEKDNLTGTLGEEGEIAGTVDFVSPEQSVGGMVDERGDIYSLGATLFALISGHPPFAGSTTQKLMQHQMAEEPAKLKKLRSRIPAALCDVIVKMMAKKPNDRYQSAEDVIDALAPWLPAHTTGNIVQDPVTLSHMISTDVAKGTKARTKRRGAKKFDVQALKDLWKRKPAAVGGGAAAAVVLLGLLIYAVTGSSKPTPGTTGPVGGPPPVAGKNPPPVADPAVVPRFQTISLREAANTPVGGPMYLNAPGDRYFFERSGVQAVLDIPFDLPNPDGTGNALINLYSPLSEIASRLPRSAKVTVGGPVQTFHVLSGVSAWGWPWGGYAGKPETGTPKGTTTVVFRIHYADGQAEDHEWKNGEHFADFIRRTDVDKSQFALSTRDGKQVRYISVRPARAGQPVAAIEFVKGEQDMSCPTVVAVTVERAGGVAVATPAPAPAAPPAASPPQAQRPAVAVGNFRLLSLNQAATVSCLGPLFLNNPVDKFEFENPGTQTHFDVPFTIPEPRAGEKAIIALHGPFSDISRAAPREATVGVNLKAKAFHFLSGIGGWSWNPNMDFGPVGTKTMTVRVRYADDTTEDHDWNFGEHFADFIDRFDVPKSEFAFKTRNGRQVRYLKIDVGQPNKVVRQLELVRADEDKSTCPVVAAVTAEASDGKAAAEVSDGKAAAPAPAGPVAVAPPLSRRPAAEKQPYTLGLTNLLNSNAPAVALKGGANTVHGVKFDVPPKGQGKPDAVRVGAGKAVSLAPFLPAKGVHFLTTAPASDAGPDAVVAKLKVSYAGSEPETHEWRAKDLPAAEGAVTKLSFAPTKTDVIRSMELTNASGTAVLYLLAVTLDPQ